MTRVVAAIGLVCVASACAGPRVPVEQMPEGGQLVARFGEARAVATDGFGRLYVVDAVASEVVVLDTMGAVLRRLGGTDDQPFLDVADVDPTNGQAIIVADAGTGRIVRYTEEGRVAETIPVPQIDDLLGRAGDGAGRPIAVAAGPGSVLYAIEAERGLVLRWDADRQLDRVLGGSSSSRPLLAPFALAVSDEGTLLVADTDRIIVFDAFGSVQDEYPVGGALNVAVAEGVELAVGGDAILRLDGGGDIPIALGEALVDVAIIRPHLYLLTQTRLVRVPLQSESW